MSIDITTEKHCVLAAPGPWGDGNWNAGVDWLGGGGCHAPPEELSPCMPAGTQGPEQGGVIRTDAMQTTEESNGPCGFSGGLSL